MASSAFHPEALLEYADATNYYLQEVSARVADAFITAVESAIRDILAAPDRWRVIEQPGIRRYILYRFPYVLYYRLEAEQERVTIYAVMHCSRKPGYWKERVT
jgi:plasmid stabilization system protein ParE